MIEFQVNLGEVIKSEKWSDIVYGLFLIEILFYFQVIHSQTLRVRSQNKVKTPTGRGAVFLNPGLG